MYWGRTLILSMAAIALVAGCTTSAPASSPDATASSAAGGASPSGRAGGLADPAALQGRWWSWAASAPRDSNPVRDPDGTFCAENQAPDVWFLAGNFGGQSRRKCSVPAGLPVAFPVVNFTGTADDCKTAMADASGTAVLDGKPLDVARHSAVPIRIKGVEGNPVTREAGTFSALACGLWVRLDALPTGPHSLTISGSSGDFRLDVTYALQVG
jgi:hypothetical protein